VAPTPSGLVHADVQAQSHSESSATSFDYDVATPIDQLARSVASSRPIKTWAGARRSDPGHVATRPERANGADVSALPSAEEKSKSHSRSGVSVGERTSIVRMDRPTPVMYMKATIEG